MNSNNNKLIKDGSCYSCLVRQFESYLPVEVELQIKKQL